MPNTYTQVYMQIVFAVARRDTLLKDPFREEVHKYITGIVQQRGHKLIAINSMPDHVHILIGYDPRMALADLVRDVKASSSRFINESGWLRTRFAWQEGYGAFSYSRSQLDAVVKYIDNQQEHHKRRSFRDEYIEMLQKFQVEYDPRYVFEFFDEPDSSR